MRTRVFLIIKCVHERRFKLYTRFSSEFLHRNQFGWKRRPSWRIFHRPPSTRKTIRMSWGDRVFALAKISAIYCFDFFVVFVARSSFENVHLQNDWLSASEQEIADGNIETKRTLRDNDGPAVIENYKLNGLFCYYYNIYLMVNNGSISSKIHVLDSRVTRHLTSRSEQRVSSPPTLYIYIFFLVYRFKKKKNRFIRNKQFLKKIVLYTSIDTSILLVPVFDSKPNTNAKNVKHDDGQIVLRSYFDRDTRE